MRIGFSTGFMHKEVSPVSIKALEICRSVSTEAIEINCIGGLDERGSRLLAIRPEELDGFSYISLHSPSKVRYDNDDPTRSLLAEIEYACQIMPIQIVVFHPDLIDCWEIFSEFKIPCAFENMDFRKKFGRTIPDLQQIFSRCDARFVLDLNHCYSVDPTMATAWELIRQFSDRLCEVHLSGFTTYHELLYETLQDEIMDTMPEMDVPIILESGCKSVADVKKEYDYVSNYLRNK